MAAITDTSISNSALIKIGAQRINNLDESNKRAQLCKEQFPKIKVALLRSHPWNFAIKRVELSMDTTAPVFEYTNQYTLPSDCLRVLRLEDENIVFKVEGTKLLTNSDVLKMEYIADVATGNFDPMFAETFAFKLALDIAYALTNSSSLQVRLKNDYDEFRRDSRSADAQEGTPLPVTNDEWVESRL
jgi:hypothetical protein